jgi:hypothetical protein
MQKIIISVSHSDDTSKYWSDSQIKNKTIEILDGENIHDAIRRVIEKEDYCTFSYKGKPQGNIYRDDKDGNSHVVGYHYRTKHDIQNENYKWSNNVPFTTWVTIHGELSPLELVDIEN